MRLKRYPMVVAPLFDSPAALQLPCAAYGMLMRLCMHAWATGFAPMPIADSELKHIARAHGPQWHKHKPLVMAAFEDWLEPARTYHLWRLSSRTQLRIAGQSGAFKRDAMAARERITEAMAARASPTTHHTHLAPSPQRDPSPPRPPTPDKRPPRPIRSDTLSRA